MENTEPKKLGGGLLTIVIINMILYILSICGSIIILITSNSANEEVRNALASTNPTEITINLILSIVLVISLILILLKQSIGVYIYFIITIADIAYSISSNGFKPITLASFILPVLMLIFVYLKKDVFWNKDITK
ncbi:hypothetical protein CPAST_c01960 [Clostridium pasteurianum DSM 525 = ATCC 6013]|uniref:Uncharacterized protein n=1 Tax=Clostridium pasteurianum DSM 525 = ATCC 6013 TaxID=1262449 RepID=A0A0H3IXT7_CLOPA|nr:hypothetical protein [Clostridium pasteurianum]AJA46296.1 hypothetical protein CPAST_c01960 [Clostridium pasteurianum DSM 525 = ATCC 6013]AJA50284.1 hypothetical protein CLPA_c01960 [Clostridium pasteurianum DSM 525 = ATCC 6013]AOZ73747.1 hypothetical protein AQ983_00965 [Clostridium pasteurianum DSM 525 = ATCC 6013]AOZ77544.1 hypothetical protein AQ984_00965 [Clostridium pasteurianum]ELP60880.1 membrane protein [Clostridium pasteurianum DSM 525 = ATCC 6013]